jgi:hypothetical protein
MSIIESCEHERDRKPLVPISLLEGEGSARNTFSHHDFLHQVNFTSLSMLTYQPNCPYQLCFSVLKLCSYDLCYASLWQKLKRWVCVLLCLVQWLVWFGCLVCNCSSIYTWVVVWNFFPIQLTFMFFRGVGIPPTDRWPPAEVHRPQRFGDESVQITQWKLRQKKRVFELQMATLGMMIGWFEGYIFTETQRATTLPEGNEVNLWAKSGDFRSLCLYVSTFPHLLIETAPRPRSLVSQHPSLPWFQRQILSLFQWWPVWFLKL